MRYVILCNAVQQGPKFASLEEAMDYARKEGFTKDDGSQLDERYRLLEVDKWKQD